MAYNLLKGKNGIVFGALVESSIAWKIAQAIHREGGRMVLTNAPVTKRFGELDRLSSETDGSPVIYADATSQEELKELLEASTDHFGAKLDFIVHSIGMGVNLRKGKKYTELDYDWYHKTLDISAISLHRVITAALELDSLAPGASIVTMTYIGAQRVFSKYSEMGDAKALLESIVRSYGYRLGGRGVRINSISQSPTPTKAGQGISGFDAMFAFSDTLSPLGNASAESCADYTVVMLSDLTRAVTMQNLYNDGGFSSMGMAESTVRMMMSFHDEPGEQGEEE
jgi:enoyl-[acyl-carrier protein] reductase I